MKNYKRFISITFLFLACFTGTLNAESRVGAGFIIGDPSGLTAKLYFNEEYAADIGIGAGIHDNWYFYSDFFKHFSNLFPLKELAFYVGLGVGYYDHEREKDRNSKENVLEIRMPFGVEYTFRQVPVGLFAEVVPATEVDPDVGFNLRGGTGARYYF